MFNDQGIMELINDIKINSGKINLHGKRQAASSKYVEHSRKSSNEKNIDRPQRAL